MEIHALQGNVAAVPPARKAGADRRNAAKAATSLSQTLAAKISVFLSELAHGDGSEEERETAKPVYPAEACVD
jgi:hypothetical protein